MSHAFTPSKKGLFFADVKGDTAHVLVNTVDMNKIKYTVELYTNAHKAQLIQTIIGHPSTNDNIITCKKFILNCPITKANILHSEDILGPNKLLKGRMTRKMPERVTISSSKESHNGMVE